MKLKKKEGSIHKFGIPLFTVIAVFILIMMFLKYSSVLEKRYSIDVISRNYLLKMETVGSLQNSEQQNLLHDLERIGAKDISLVGTTLNKVGYGKDITLMINCNLEIEEYSVKDLFEIQKGIKTINVNIERTSTAKH